MKLNRKGFTLIEILAVIVILSILMAIMVPTVNHVINKNKEDNYKELEKGIINAAKMYLSDNRYNITLDSFCTNPIGVKSINYIGDNALTNSAISIKTLVDNKYLKTQNNKIINPRDKTILNLEASTVKVQFDCSKKNYTYTIESDSLFWNN